MVDLERGTRRSKVRWWTWRGGLGGQRSDGGLGEGDSEVLVVVQLVVVQSDQSLDGFLHRRQLHQSHLPVLPVIAEEVTSSNTWPQGGKEEETWGSHVVFSHMTLMHQRNMKYSSSFARRRRAAAAAAKHKQHLQLPRIWHKMSDWRWMFEANTDLITHVHHPTVNSFSIKTKTNRSLRGCWMLKVWQVRCCYSLEKLEGFYCESTGGKQILQLLLADRGATRQRGKEILISNQTLRKEMMEKIVTKHRKM